jgi:hypothetical protein
MQAICAAFLLTLYIVKKERFKKYFFLNKFRNQTLIEKADV